MEKRWILYIFLKIKNFAGVTCTEIQNKYVTFNMRSSKGRRGNAGKCSPGSVESLGECSPPEDVLGTATTDTRGCKTLVKFCTCQQVKLIISLSQFFTLWCTPPWSSFQTFQISRDSVSCHGLLCLQKATFLKHLLYYYLLQHYVFHKRVNTL